MEAAKMSRFDEDNLKLMTYTAILSVLGAKYRSKSLLSSIGEDLAGEEEGTGYQQERGNAMEEEGHNEELPAEQEKGNVLGEMNMEGGKQETRHNSQYAQVAQPTQMEEPVGTLTAIAYLLSRDREIVCVAAKRLATKHLLEVTVGITEPKPHTPFAWAREYAPRPTIILTKNPDQAE